METPSDSLLPYGAAVDLGNCEREPIHTPGHIQAHGALLVLDPRDLTVLQVSANVDALLGGGGPDDWLGRRLVEKFPGADRWPLGALGPDFARLEDNPQLVVRAILPDGKAFDVVAHRHAGLLLMEVEPVDLRADWSSVVTGTQAAIRRLVSIDDVATYCDRLAREVRAITGYDRVMVYRFDDDWHGWVAAEAKRADLAPFLGLHYPASDIPAQARRLFLTNTIRLLPDARYPHLGMHPELLDDGAPLDMSRTFLRGASRMYTEYLENMGVRGTLTMALAAGDQLWGMIACHHYEGPRHLPYEARSSCELIAHVASLQIGGIVARARARRIEELAQRQLALLRSLSIHEDVVEGMLSAEADVLGAVDCGGFVLSLEGQSHGLGDVPPTELVSQLVAWLETQGRDAVRATDHLGELVPDAAAHADCAAGVLAVPLAYSPRSWALWFRPEQVRHVDWAGDPHKPVRIGPLGDRLTPRKSFELWRETVRGRSLPWDRAEIEAMERVRIGLSDVVFRERERLVRLTRELAARNVEIEQFAYLASHDLREPLRGIRNYMRFLVEDDGERLSDAGREYAEAIQRIGTRMHAQLDGMLAFSRLGTGPVELEPVDLAALLAEVLEDSAERIRDREATIELGTLPTLTTWRSGVAQVLSNLLTNALKYSKGPPHVRIDAAPEPDGRSWTISVADRGVGLAPEHHERVFAMFQRAHPGERDGVGIGLALVRKIVERLGGRVWVESAPDQGATFAFTLRDDR